MSEAERNQGLSIVGSDVDVHLQDDWELFNFNVIRGSNYVEITESQRIGPLTGIESGVLEISTFEAYCDESGKTSINIRDEQNNNPEHFALQRVNSVTMADANDRNGVVKFYPNPSMSGDVLSLELAFEAKYFEILTPQGMKVCEGELPEATLNGSSFGWNLNFSIESGIYILKLRDQNNIVSTLLDRR